MSESNSLSIITQKLR